MKITSALSSTAIPPLSQSRHGDMACGILYAHKHIECTPVPNSEPATRGTAIHQVLAAYIDHLVGARRATDLEKLDALMRGTSGEGRAILEKFRDNHFFDHEKILGSELHVELDEDFRPLAVSDRPGRVAAFEGTLDLVMLHSFTEAEIADWKSYYQVADADTFQSKLYPLLLMCLNPALEKVKFVLEFVRYGVSRCVEYRRKDVAWLKNLAQRERERQKRFHGPSSPADLTGKATPGRHCTWCPLLLGGCPVAQTNPYGNMSPQERLGFAVWLQEAEKQNTRVLKDLLASRGPLTYRDANQTTYVADFALITKKSYRYADAFAVLNEWFRAHPEEHGLWQNLTVSGLSSAIKADKRAELREKLASAADEDSATELRITRKKSANLVEGGMSDTAERSAQDA